MIHGMPGPGGNLGQCVVCGESFVVETLMSLSGCGGMVKIFHIEGIEGDVCVHDRELKNCAKALEKARDEGWETLPEGPLRKVYAEAFAQQKEESPDVP